MKITVTKYGTEPQKLDVDRIEIDQNLVVTDAGEGILIQAFDRMDIRPKTENSVVITAV